VKYEYKLTAEISCFLEGEELVRTNTKFQELIIVQTKEFGKVLFLDGVCQLSEKDEHIYHESMVHPAMLAHKNPKKVIVIGGGDGGVLKQVLKYPVEKAVQIELDPGVVENSKKHLPSVSEGSLDDKRVEILYEDGRKYLEETDEKFDVIFLDLTEPTGPSAKLFTKEFYSLVQSRLSEGGIVSLDTDNFRFNGVFGHLIKTLEAVYPNVYPYSVNVPTYFMNQGFAICSNHDLNFMKDGNKVQELVDSRKINMKMHDGKTISDLFTRTPVIVELMKQEWKVSTDAVPIEIDVFVKK